MAMFNNRINLSLRFLQDFRVLQKAEDARCEGGNSLISESICKAWAQKPGIVTHGI